jgi:hypothetical protein
VKLFFQSSSRIRHKSDSIQLTVSLQRDRKENGAESFHCDRIAPPNSATSAMQRKSRVKKSSVRKIAQDIRRGKISLRELPHGNF